MIEPHYLRIDLGLLGLTEVARFDRQSCPGCKAMDTQYDADVLAVARGSRPQIVSYRDQSSHSREFRTLTFRASTDSGGSDTQVRKIIEGRSLATLFLQSYRSFFTWAHMSKHLQERLAANGARLCGSHPKVLEGLDGQTFIPICAECYCEFNLTKRMEM